jgi:molybdopterin molybdotransferase
MMIPVDEALGRIFENLPPPVTEKIDSLAAYGRVLAESLAAASEIPPFSKSAVDGYAVRSADMSTVPAELRCVGESRAGAGSRSTLEPCEAIPTMTGAPVPAGADAVQMIEKTRRSADGARVVILKAVHPGENIIPAGSQASAGEVVLETGRYIGPAEAAILAMFGRRELQVFRKPRVALAATGDELVEADQAPGPDQIRNSNVTSLTAQLRPLGLEPEYLGIARDDKARIRRVVLEGLCRDVLILTGGVSVGTYDFVGEILREIGLEVIFSGVAIRPGKPTVFARQADRLVFGLPGNPISTLVSFELFVRPALERICGLASTGLYRVHGRLLFEVKHKADRTSYLPAWISWNDEGWAVRPLLWKGSSDIIGFSRANGLFVLPRETKSIARGGQVEVLLLPDFLQRSARQEG